MSPFLQCGACRPGKVYRLFQVKQYRWHDVTKLNQSMLAEDASKAYEEVKKIRADRSARPEELQDALFRYLVDKVRLDQGGEGMDVVRASYRAQDSEQIIKQMQDEIKRQYLR